ncbi:flavin-containing monooxygenase [Altererythrobacter ishigakiensis]|uniref:Cation diffusion facilitator CzcD-associated flavoprotein CzcO n=1 Tax=Altererythrobacter ishigakiensis TaxID=476157 RepID=A0A562UM49_9SPHN|nr:NAD(P)/FAD-dependent oxidoreductase [Altererythrobacter ishigakiensis]TWJ06690.1 cation diffusion facilitator CzcD-associated flavoprotein CzcO [Altererythrobacter ishigakiensis]
MESTEAMTPIDREAIRRKYAIERDKRLRADGGAQYKRLESEFSDLAADPYNPVVAREAVNDHVTFAFIGGGFAGLVVGARLKEAGIDDYRIIDKGGDFGGTWYWNRYPGAQCDTASMIYMPLLEETGHMPSEKYAHAPEIRDHCSRIGEHYGLYENAMFHTRVTDLAWDETQKVWQIQTDRGDKFTAKYIGMGTGPLHVAKLPGLPGIENFAGKSFHTSRWDYAYTGGTPEGEPMSKLSDKRVAIIGTGATAVQCVPHLARDAKELFVFQRTPSSVDERNNAAIDPTWFGGVNEPGWQKKWQDNFVANLGMGFPTEDLVDDGWTDLGKRIRSQVIGLAPEQRTPANIMAAWEDADHGKMEEIRQRAATVVNDPQTSENLKAWYRQLCKRPCFHDEYLQAFNRPSTHLIDTDGKGVERITEKGVVANGVEYKVDCIIYASGFEVSTDFVSRSGYDVTGRGGIKLSEYWQDGMRSFHGLHVHGFPNLFFVQQNQAAAFIANYPHNLVDHAETVATVVKHAQKNSYQEVEPTEEAQEKWVAFLLTGPGARIGNIECTPGYYNNEGQGFGEQERFALGHPAGAQGFFNHIEAWRNSGSFEGLAFK